MMSLTYTVNDVHCEMLELVRCHLVTVFEVSSEQVTGHFESRQGRILPCFTVHQGERPLTRTRPEIQDTIAAVIRLYSSQWEERLVGVRCRRAW